MMVLVILNMVWKPARWLAIATERSAASAEYGSPGTIKSTIGMNTQWKKIVIHTMPSRLKSRCTLAARLASVEAPMAAMLAVTVVPIFSPRTSAHAVWKSMSPWTASVMVIAIVALEDCRSIVTAVPMATTSSMPGTPVGRIPGHKIHDALGTAQVFHRAAHHVEPQKEHAEAEQNLAVLPQLFIVHKPNKKSQSYGLQAKTAILTLKPKMATSQPVTVVPIFAPNIIPTDC